MVPDQQYSLRWGEYRSTLIEVFERLQESETLVDCTLSAEGQTVQAHKAVLSACSPYFELLLSQHGEKHPVVILKDVKYRQLKAMVEYMYRGEVIVSKDQIESLLAAAESVQIKGLTASRENTVSEHKNLDGGDSSLGESSLGLLPLLPTAFVQEVGVASGASLLAPPVVELRAQSQVPSFFSSAAGHKAIYKTESDEESLLHWSEHATTLVTVFERLLESGSLADCTLAAEGQYLKAHKAVLSASSPYFEHVLNQYSEKHPIIILRDVKFQQLKSMIEYMYRGEVVVSKKQLESLRIAAYSLQIKGLVASGDSTIGQRNPQFPVSHSAPYSGNQAMESLQNCQQGTNSPIGNTSSDIFPIIDSKTNKLEDCQQFSLRWGDHGRTLMSVFQKYLDSSALVDCTLAAEGQLLKAHKSVLSACSLYFELLLSQHAERHPVIILKDIKFEQLKAIVNYMYHGEVIVSKDQIESLRLVAESLQVKGLAKDSDGDSAEEREIENVDVKEMQPLVTRLSKATRSKERKKHKKGDAALAAEDRVSSDHPAAADPKTGSSTSEDAASDLERTQKMELMSAILLQRKSEDVEKSAHEDSDDNYDPLPEMDESDDVKPTSLDDVKPPSSTLEKILKKIKIRRGRMLAGDRPFKCLECGKTYRQQSSLSTHKRSHRGDVYRCDACNKPFNHRSHLIRHLHVHTARVEKLYPCTVCGKVYKQPGSLATHSRQHDEIYKCDLCNKEFTKRLALIRHMNVHSSEKLYKCHICEKAYRQRSSLSTHHRVHRGEGVMCDVCGKVFNDSSHLKRHTRAHTGEKPYKCPTCGKAFAQHFILTNHVRIHTGEKPFICELCGKAFRQPGSLHNHRRDMHNGPKKSASGEHRSADHRSDLKQGDHRPIDHRPVDHRPVDHRPVDHRPMERQPVDHRPMDHRPMDHRPVDHRLVDHRAVEQGLVDHRPLDHRLMDHRPIDHRPIDHRSIDHRPIDHRPIDHRPIDHRPIDHRPIDHRPIDHRPIDHRPVDHRQLDHRQMDHRPVDLGSVDHRALDHGSLGHRPVAPTFLSVVHDLGLNGDKE